MRPDQLADFRVPSDAYFHPDGVRVVFVVTQMDLEEDEYVRQLWIWDGASTRQLTSGRSDFSPRWSPDGSKLAFLRKAADDDAKAQIAVMHVDGGEADVVTEAPLGVSQIEWSPDGSKIAYVASEYVEEMEDDKERDRRPRRIDHPSFRFDNTGWTYDNRTHIWVLDVEAGSVEQLTMGEFSESGIAWSPDGERLTFQSSVLDDRWVKPFNQIFTIGVGQSGDQVAVTEPGAWAWSGYSPDGSLFAIGRVTDTVTLHPLQMHRLDGEGATTQLTDLDRNLMPGHPPGPLAAPRFVDGGWTCVLEDRGEQRVIFLDSDGVTSDVVGGHRVITGWDPGPERTVAVFTATDPTQPGEVYLWDGSTETQITSLNDDFIASADLIDPQEFTYESDGNEIHGWVFLPDGDAKVPLLFNIHGGPAAQYGWGFFDEFQVYSAAGYGIVATNPRGSSGYGYDHVSVPCGRWGEDMPPDMLDLTTAPRAAAKLFDRLDTSNMGIMGGSYGGLSTAIITSLDQTYKSAVAERGVYNWVSMAGTSDIPFFMELYLGTDMPHGAEELWKASPLARAHAITTPTLVIHSETDFRCPVEQGQQFFSLLYHGGVDVELLLFPTGEGHELSRGGSPKHRVERFDAILEWHASHLLEDATT